MNKQNNSMVVKCMALHTGNAAFKWERSLDLILLPGFYHVEIDNHANGIGLPIDDCGEEHYIVGNLIVCECGTKGPKQHDKVTGLIRLRDG